MRSADDKTQDIANRVLIESVLRALLALVDACEIYLGKERTAEMRRKWKEHNR